MYERRCEGWENGNTNAFPFEPDEFWSRLRLIIREEVARIQLSAPVSSSHQVSGLIQKPLYKIGEVCELFQVSRPTIYEWIKHGKLRPVRIRSRVFFLWDDLQQLFQGEERK